jgi:hypothetical protein
MDKVRLVWQGGRKMMRRLPWLGLVLGALCLPQIGCETHRSWLRPKEDEDAKPRASEASKIPAVDSDEKNPQPFFQNNRRSGGWSSEARDIESDLGVK